MRTRVSSWVMIVSFMFVPLAKNSTQAHIPIPSYLLNPHPIATGKASWYSENDPGINTHTANNEIFNDQGLTAAMWDVPFNQNIKVTNLENGKSIIVRINDRGPHKRYVQEGRIIDLSQFAFSSLAPLSQGLIPIQLEFL